jgi:hypothetical protein
MCNTFVLTHAEGLKKIPTDFEGYWEVVPCSQYYVLVLFRSAVAVVVTAVDLCEPLDDLSLDRG